MQVTLEWMVYGQESHKMHKIHASHFDIGNLISIENQGKMFLYL